MRAWTFSTRCRAFLEWMTSWRRRRCSPAPLVICHDMSDPWWTGTPPLLQNQESQHWSIQKAEEEARKHRSTRTQLHQRFPRRLLLLQGFLRHGLRPRWGMKRAAGQAPDRPGQVHSLLNSISPDDPASVWWSHTSGHMATRWMMDTPQVPSLVSLVNGDDPDKQGAESEDNVGDCTRGRRGKRCGGELG